MCRCGDLRRQVSKTSQPRSLPTTCNASRYTEGMELDATLCYCFHIKKRKIVNYIRQTRPQRASQVSDCFGAGTGCGWCVPFLKKLHQEVMAGKEITSDDISSDEYEALREAYRDELRDGTRERNSYATAEIPAELTTAVDTDDVSTQITAATSQPKPVGDPKSEEMVADPTKGEEWDVSDYFSRRRPPEPEPDEIE